MGPSLGQPNHERQGGKIQERQPLREMTMKKNSKIDIQFLRAKDGRATPRHDWQPTVGHAFRQGNLELPPYRRLDDAWVDSQEAARAAVGF